ncbi:hypothetical protein ACOSP7_000621 [Xanthoceras sorbifolium]
MDYGSGYRKGYESTVIYTSSNIEITLGGHVHGLGEFVRPSVFASSYIWLTAHSINLRQQMSRHMVHCIARHIVQLFMKFNRGSIKWVATLRIARLGPYVA